MPGRRRCWSAEPPIEDQYSKNARIRFDTIHRLHRYRRHVADAVASDHLDTPTVVVDPAADIGDLYAWTSPDVRRLNLVMDVVGKRFSYRIAYVFHVDSGRRFGKTRATTTIDCRFDAEGSVVCAAAGDRAAGIAQRPACATDRCWTASRTTPRAFAIAILTAVASGAMPVD